MNIRAFTETNAKPLLIGSISVAVLAAIAWWFFFYDMRLTVNVTPASATVTIDGTDVSGQKNVKLKPGNHSVKVTLNDFIAFEQIVKASSSKYADMNVTLRSIPHLQSVTKDATANATYDATNHQLYYVDKTTGTADRITLTTADAIPKPQTLTPAGALSSVDSLLWAPDYSSALTKKNNAWSLYDFNRFDLLHQEQTAWPSGVGSVTWNPSDTTQLAHYFAASDGSQTLTRTNPLHQSYDILLNFRDSGITNPIVKWVGKGNDIVLQSQEGRLWRFVVYSKALTAITQSETVSDSITSPDGQTLLVRDTNGALFTIGIDGTNKKTIDIQVPLSQVVWSADSQHIWFTQNTNSTLTETSYTISTGEKATYSIAASETVGTIDSVAIAEDQSKLLLAGSTGLAIVRLEPIAYAAVTVK